MNKMQRKALHAERLRREAARGAEQDRQQRAQKADYYMQRAFEMERRNRQRLEVPSGLKDEILTRMAHEIAREMARRAREQNSEEIERAAFKAAEIIVYLWMHQPLMQGPELEATVEELMEGDFQFRLHLPRVDMNTVIPRDDIKLFQMEERTAA